MSHTTCPTAPIPWRNLLTPDIYHKLIIRVLIWKQDWQFLKFFLAISNGNPQRISQFVKILINFFFFNLIGSSGITSPNTNLSYAMLCYAQYLSNSTLVSCVAYGGAMQFQFPWIDSFSGLGPFFKNLTLKNPA